MDTDRQDEDQTRQAGKPSKQNQQADQQPGTQTRQRQESGLPGSGVGRREDPGHTGVYPMSSSEGASPDAPLQNENAWGQGERGAAGYNDSGDSGMLEGQAKSGEGEHDEEQG